MNDVTNEFSRPVRTRQLPEATQALEAAPGERAALARRFDIVAVNSLRADIALDHDGDAITATGTLKADVVQSCAVSGEDLPVRIAEPLSFRFLPARLHDAEEEVELEASELDEIFYEGESFDLGEAIAQSLALAIDPFACGPDADRVRQEKGLAADDQPSGPFAALAALKGK
ncbi:YceD family protein [Pseudopontixanthobacter vadosimaris]|uniref:YceD family protein n=1 Tax=Pseudopontixanthobacter vadosimaris TaxID=2726450 RepID=UPI0014767262|nr:DUF177 domain-containing protein [Pseudopontixanthobacter vadosimaris]